MVDTITTAASPALDHIIERPRLIARLEEGGGSRVAMFAAPAGYGKTTLARQWSQRQVGPVVGIARLAHRETWRSWPCSWTRFLPRSLRICRANHGRLRRSRPS